MLSELVVSGTERLLLMLGWERENNTAAHRTLHAQDASYGQLKSEIRNMKKKANNANNANNTATPMFNQQPTLRPVQTVSHAPSQAQAWTSASAFDAAPSGTV